MKKLALVSLVSLLGLGIAGQTVASPQEEAKAFRDYFLKKFPDTKLEMFTDGIYGIDKDRREEWLAMEEFPPYEPGLAVGKQLFEKHKIGDCFKNGGIGIRQNYPYFDATTGTIKNLEAEIMECLTKKGVDLEKEKFRPGRGKLTAINAYMSYTSRGNKINIVIPNDPRALAAYEMGKKHFWSKRGQLNLACSDCHVQGSGQLVRSNLLSPALGHTTGFPVYRKNWEAADADPVLGGFGSVQRRYKGCNEQVRAKGFKEQSEEYLALEYYEAFMSNGLPINGPSVRQ